MAPFKWSILFLLIFWLPDGLASLDLNAVNERAFHKIIQKNQMLFNKVEMEGNRCVNKFASISANAKEELEAFRKINSSSGDEITNYKALLAAPVEIKNLKKVDACKGAIQSHLAVYEDQINKMKGPLLIFGNNLEKLQKLHQRLSMQYGNISESKYGLKCKASAKLFTNDPYHDAVMGFIMDHKSGFMEAIDMHEFVIHELNKRRQALVNQMDTIRRERAGCEGASFAVPTKKVEAKKEAEDEDDEEEDAK